MKKMVWRLLICVIVAPSAVLSSSKSSPNVYVEAIPSAVSIGFALYYCIVTLGKKRTLTLAQKEEMQKTLQKIPLNDLNTDERNLFEKINTAVKNNDFNSLKKMADTSRFSPRDKEIIETAFKKVEKAEQLSLQEKEFFDKTLRPLLRIQDTVIPEKKNLLNDTQEEDQLISKESLAEYSNKTDDENEVRLRELDVDSEAKKIDTPTKSDVEDSSLKAAIQKALQDSEESEKDSEKSEKDSEVNVVDPKEVFLKSRDEKKVDDDGLPFSETYA